MQIWQGIRRGSPLGPLKLPSSSFGFVSSAGSGCAPEAPTLLPRAEGPLVLSVKLTPTLLLLPTSAPAKKKRLSIHDLDFEADSDDSTWSGSHPPYSSPVPATADSLQVSGLWFLSPSFPG